ncbi:BREX-3 system phosphatase PglZ [Polyangium mundeleinium]|uniref:BREX-3 system phosphatase PglZ n=1 Tax=Polyangium mundeleinium TaxID=2995306 RepID=A0ABT5EIU6_9BACT|nr:BREX-3 system phosphatase PglZ [Polyangium mundeleinium]MDC0740862.1 BREX-3 system phosphatase PglZ [Polyangium mundeleinium]
MTSWRDPILSHFTPEIAAVSRLTIVADPDQLLMERGIVDGVRERGFEILAFDDHAVFRYAYEQRFRRVWDRGKPTKLVVVLRAPRAELDWLPYDLLQEAKRESRILSFSVAELFPNLQPHVIADLDRNELEAVHAAQALHQPGPLGVNATREFLLRHVFEVVPELIRAPSDLLRVLLRRHHSGRVFPASLDEHLIRQLKNSRRWDAWPLDQIVPNRAGFLGFLQERWPIFVKQNRFPQPDTLAEPPASDPCGLRYPGPTDLPFDHDDVRVYMDNLFVEGLLTPTKAVSKASVRGTWLAVGVSGDEAARGRKLLDLLEDKFPGADSDHHQWLQAAQRWGEALAVRWALKPTLAEPEHLRFETMHERIEAAFQGWLQSHYASLSSLAPWPRPVMVHHVLRFLAHSVTGTSPAKRALIVVDGLSLDQWAVIRPELPVGTWLMDENALFAWVPTLTSVSRQSIFAADPPFFFASSIGTTSKEEQHWSRFWEDHGLRKNEIAYLCQKDQEHDDLLLERVREHAEQPKCKALAIVVGTVDQMLHGVVTGTDGLHASVRHWAQRGWLAKLLGMLLDAGFEVSLTADHGNIEGQGIGKPNVGETVEQRGERVHVFRDDRTRDNVAGQYPGTIVWPTIGLPDEYLSLIAPARRAFINSGKRAVVHGGVCVEEVIVPFVRITRTP